MLGCISIVIDKYKAHRIPIMIDTYQHRPRQEGHAQPQLYGVGVEH